MWGRGLKQRETRDINIQPKAGDFCGFSKVFDATLAGVLVPHGSRRLEQKRMGNPAVNRRSDKGHCMMGSTFIATPLTMQF